MRRFSYKDGKLFFDKEFKHIVPYDNKTYEILRHVKIPPHLTDVIIYEQSYEQSLTGLIFVGSDSKGRRQYFYGKLHIKKRNHYRNEIFIRVYNIIHEINKFIDENIKKNSDIDFQSAVFLLMETSFFIRIGKMCYHKENETVGLLTLKNKHVTSSKNKILINFMGKDKVFHEFTVHKSNRLYKPLLKLINQNNPDEFLFNKLSERKVYKMMNKFNIRLKDLRTYGVNYTFLYNFWTNVKSLNPIPSTKKLITLSIKQTAEIVGHTPSISKSAYMANTVIEFLIQDSEILKIIKDISFDEFIKMIVEYVRNRETI
ncbi:DNA topoisomerase [Deerpox virus W-848-83]|uniref:DNA topoisomerase n=1 Tax=Deerpox virus (strain Mule deer/United States/W-848-83/1983) TaxID=305674 RepID=Q08FR6_DPV83|nr:DNA topoisomerase [Deerpox virus W-848-83]ABI99241.1 DNA topoisomerase [Deerpox virus W-848-83]